MKKYFYLINVIIGNSDGYSFMVFSTEKMKDDEVIYLANQMGYFECEYDAECAFVDDSPSDYDIKHFESINCLFEL